jgi:hypothetical protein
LSKAKVVDHAQVRKKLKRLEDHADPRAELRQVCLRIGEARFVEYDVAALKRFKRVNALDESGLSGAGRAANDDDFALRDASGTVFQDLERSVGLTEGFDFDHERESFN